MTTPLERLRGRIDLIDGELLRLLEERMELCLKTRRLKNTTQDADRERQVIEAASSTRLDLVTPSFASALMSSIMAESRRLQDDDIRLVGFQGTRGAYSEIAARILSPASAPVPCARFDEVFSQLEQGVIDLGVVPVENSLEGPVAPVTELLSRTPLHVVDEVTVPITHCLLATTPDREVRFVYSHPQALAQCRSFLSRRGLEPCPYYDTAGAARMLARDDPPACAALASSLSAELYNLHILAKNAADSPSNSTRFLLLSRTPGP
jgi:chorismate mutase